MSVRPVVDAAVGHAFRTLVRQFSQELCFYRELVQNAIDAGTDRVDIWLEHADDVGVIHVRDVGEGMDREVIDTRLTRLFASSKAGDYTQIGQFGIGFVSVFAIEPHAVVVDTARHGEVWRIVFQPDGAFERIRLQQPLEGTHVRLYKPMPAAAWPQFVERSAAALAHWCRYSAVPIFFNGRSITAPLGLDSPLQVRHREAGTEVVAGLVPPDQCRYGFYRGGITVWEGAEPVDPHAEPLPAGISFRVSSRYLETTLSRDAVKAGDKVMEVVRRVVYDSLADRLLDELESATDTYTARLELGLPLLRSTLASRAADRRCLATLNGKASLDDLRRAAAPTRALLSDMGSPYPAGVVFCEPVPTPTTRALTARNLPIMKCTVGDALWTLLQHLGFHPTQDLLQTVEPVAERNVSSRVQGLVIATRTLLRRAGLPLAGVRWGRWRSTAGPCMWASQVDTLADPRALPRGPRPTLVVDPDHLLVTTLAQSIDSFRACYLLARAVCLLPGVPPGLETRLLIRTMEACDV